MNIDHIDDETIAAEADAYMSNKGDKTMTIKEASALWPIIKAYSEGKTIEIYDTDLELWHTVINPKFVSGARYRVKKLPTRKQLAEFSKWANDTLKQEMVRRGWNLEGYFVFSPYDLDDKSSLDLNK